MRLELRRKRLLAGLAIVLWLGLSVGVSEASTSQPGQALPDGCTDSSPCHFARGTYHLGPGTVLPGLQFTLPRGWSSGENDQGELNLVPPGRPQARLFVWMDVEAVKSAGKGHGTTVLRNIGRTSPDLVSWLTTNSDFLVVAPPKPTRIAERIPATTLTVGVSKSANYGDPGCPANPRCADLFTNHWWGTNSYGIGGAEEVQLSISSIKRGAARDTLIVALDAGTGTDNGGLVTLRRVVRPILASFRLPERVSAG
ncbi:MAG TPA: hypothetical protein VF091_00265 [Gaiellaceae bacterium]